MYSADEIGKKVKCQNTSHTSVVTTPTRRTGFPSGSKFGPLWAGRLKKSGSISARRRLPVSHLVAALLALLPTLVLSRHAASPAETPICLAMHAHSVHPMERSASSETPSSRARASCR
eukprot:CAMPEP_0182826372 /NCGR_PEP_ID=MMETSP0006_2-20121128/16340_1 /TAXON_ID=97485 /ORGANISM="Prymnesium parvum, Strain Texoma1" /LENGTH=117 /DNA_ID=CAMNT_0024953535 /DNA_START=1745 /DNA_END=2094 /DNA_ORIENTATION=-